MYQIVSLQGGGKRVVVGTSEDAGKALGMYRAAQNTFPELIILDPTGAEIDGFELIRRYEAEERRRSY